MAQYITLRGELSIVKQLVEREVAYTDLPEIRKKIYAKALEILFKKNKKFLKSTGMELLR